MSKADFIVVGLGASGCAVVRRLLEAGFSVIAVEAGPHIAETRPILDPYYVGSLQGEWFPVYFWQQQAVANGRLIESSNCCTCRHRITADENAQQGIQVGCACFSPASLPTQPARTGYNNYTTGRLVNGGAAINGEQFVKGSYNFWREWETKVESCLWGPENVKRVYNNILNVIDEKKSCLGEKVYSNCDLDGIEESKSKKTDGFETGADKLDIRVSPSCPTDFVVTKSIIDAWNQSRPDCPVPLELCNYNSVNQDGTFGGVNRWQLFQHADGARSLPYIPFVLEQRHKERYVEYSSATVLRLVFHDKEGYCSKPVATAVEILKDGKCIRLEAGKAVIVNGGVFSAPLLQRSGVGDASILRCNKIPVIADNRFVGRDYTNQLIMRIWIDTKEDMCSKPVKDLYTGGAFLPSLIPSDLSSRGYQVFGVIVAPRSLLILVIWLQPQSKGSVRIASRDPLAPVLADNNYYSDPKDVDAYLAFMNDILAPMVRDTMPRDWTLSSPSPELVLSSDSAAKRAWLLANLDQTHHWNGSNKMGASRESGAVDASGLVFGTDNVYVADASVCPIAPDGNPCGPAYAIGSIVANCIANRYS